MVENGGLDRDISTHTLTWSVTSIGVNANFNMKHFNSHAHVERDGKAVRKIITLNISTHTLTWSVTMPQIILIE